MAIQPEQDEAKVNIEAVPVNSAVVLSGETVVLRVTFDVVEGKWVEWPHGGSSFRLESGDLLLTHVLPQLQEQLDGSLTVTAWQQLTAEIAGYSPNVMISSAEMQADMHLLLRPGTQVQLVGAAYLDTVSRDPYSRSSVAVQRRQAGGEYQASYISLAYALSEV